jgi:hypothetical protein
MSMIERLTTQARSISRILCMAGGPSSSASTETITIGSGTGIVWTGLPFSGLCMGVCCGTVGTAGHNGGSRRNDSGE